MATVASAGGAEEPAAPPAVGVKADDAEAAVRIGDRAVLRYCFGKVPFKPCVKELRTPAGLNILRDSPHDHVHHHALMFAVSADGTDFWSERGHKRSGRQVHRALDTAADGFTAQIDWVSPRNAVVLRERRTLRLHADARLRATLLTWQSELRVPKGKKRTVLSGAHYVGLGMRFVQSMDKAGRFLNADGKAGKAIRGSERHVRSRWCAYAAQADGKPITVAMFDHPANPRGPAKWFTMTTPFAYLSATLNLHETPLAIAAGQPLALCYGVALWDGTVGKAEIESLYKRWRSLAGRPESAASPPGR